MRFWPPMPWDGPGKKRASDASTPHVLLTKTTGGRGASRIALRIFDRGAPLTGRVGLLPSCLQSASNGLVARPGCSAGLLPGERIGKTVQLRCGPAAVTGDCLRETHCQENRVIHSSGALRQGAERRWIRKPEDLPRCRFPVRVFRGKDAAAGGSGWSVAAPGRDGRPHNIAVGRRALRARLAGAGNLGLFPRRGIVSCVFLLPGHRSVPPGWPRSRPRSAACRMGITRTA